MKLHIGSKVADRMMSGSLYKLVAGKIVAVASFDATIDIKNDAPWVTCDIPELSGEITPASPYWHYFFCLDTYPVKPLKGDAKLRSGRDSGNKYPLLVYSMNKTTCN